jgi:hypothetical protein
MSHEYSTEYVLPNGGMTFSLSEYVQANVVAERERIKINIMDRVTDLKTCGKNDDCWEFGDLIESYIEEWIND